jgi:hypothetical protein
MLIQIDTMLVHDSQCKHLLAVRMAPIFGKVHVQEVEDNILHRYMDDK